MRFVLATECCAVKAVTPTTRLPSRKAPSSTRRVSLTPAKRCMNTDSPPSTSGDSTESPDEIKQAYKEENPKLYKRIKAGDQTAIKEMIVINQELVQDRVGVYIKRNEDMAYLEDDLVGDAVITLVIEVQGMATDHNIENPTGYLTTAIDRAIVTSASEDSAIHVPRRTKCKAATAGLPVPSMRRAATLYDRHAAADYRQGADLLQELRDYCWDDTEFSVIQERAKGLTLNEVCVKVDRPYPYVQRVLKAVEARYKEARRE